MYFIRRVLVGDQERVLLIKNGRFVRVLGPGSHWILGAGYTTEPYRTRALFYEGAWAEFIAKERPDVVAAHFTLVETSDAEVAVVSLDGRFDRVIGPAKQMLYWRGLFDVRAEVFDVRENPQVPAKLAAVLMRPGVVAPVLPAIVEEGKIGLLYLEGRFARTLGPGSYAFWTAASPKVVLIDQRRQAIEINGQEILTRDKVSLRVNVWAEYRIVDAVKSVETVTDPSGFLYRALQFAVRRTLGVRSLEEILAEKTDIDATVAADVRSAALETGIEVGAIALKDIVLPGDVRDILNQVVTAEKQAQANLIRRREETAATRSLLNTAKLMEDNPILIRLKELETLERVAEKVGKISIVGGVDELLGKTVTITSK